MQTIVSHRLEVLSFILYRTPGTEKAAYQFKNIVFVCVCVCTCARGIIYKQRSRLTALNAHSLPHNLVSLSQKYCHFPCPCLQRHCHLKFVASLLYGSMLYTFRWELRFKFIRFQVLIGPPVKCFWVYSLGSYFVACLSCFGVWSPTFGNHPEG